MRAHSMQSLANWRYSSALEMPPSSSHTGGSAMVSQSPAPKETLSVMRKYAPLFRQ
jgi:hypothetical protein